MKPATCAFIGAALFVGLMAAFSAIGDTPPTGGLLLVLGILGVSSHLVLLPVVSASGRAAWTRACGYSWIAIDVMLNVASINGMTLAAVTPLRLGSHVLTAVWIADAALTAGGLPRPVGLVLAALLAGHALTAPWIPAWVLFIPFVLIPVWLVLLGRVLQRAEAAGFQRAVGV
jgi:hypothetical protein